jgi:hypothetical protein
MPSLGQPLMRYASLWSLLLQFCLIAGAVPLRANDEARFPELFDQMMRRGHPVSEIGGRTRYWNDWHAHEVPAEELAKSLGSEGLPFLEVVAAQGIDLDAFERPAVLARMTLAKLEDKSIAAAALLRLALLEDGIDATMLMPISYLPRGEAGNALEKVVTRSSIKDDAGVTMVATARLLGAVGDFHSLTTLKEFALQEENALAELRGASAPPIAPDARAARAELALLLLRRTIQVMEKRLRLEGPDETRQSRLEVDFWRATHEGLSAPTIVVEAPYLDLPRLSKLHGREFPSEFLLERLRDAMDGGVVVDRSGYTLTLMMLTEYDGEAAVGELMRNAASEGDFELLARYFSRTGNARLAMAVERVVDDARLTKSQRELLRTVVADIRRGASMRAIYERSAIE